MRPFENKLTAVVSSTPVAVILGGAALMALPLAYGHHGLIPLLGNRGLAGPSPNLWFSGAPLNAMLANMLALVITAVLMAAVNSRFTILRSFSVTFVSLFLVMTAATPSVACTFEGGALLAPVILLSMAALFACYHRPDRTGLVYLAFLLPAAGSLVQYGFAIYLPVLLIGCAQMRVLTPKACMAALLGIVTPWWLWWAFARHPQLRMPEFMFLFDSPEAANRSLPLMCTMGLTILTALITGSANFLKIFSFNARARALNGLLTIVTLTTLVMFFVDFTNLVFYITLLNVTVAFQVGHCFALFARKRSYLLVMGLVAAYMGMFTWRMLTP